MPVHTVANIKIKIASAEHFSLQLSPTPRLPLIKKIRQSCKGLAGEKSPAEVRQWTWKKKIIASWKSPIPLSLFQWSIPKSDRWPSPRIPRHIREYFFICDYNDYSRKRKGTLFICDLFKNQKEKYYYRCVYYFDVTLSNESFTENENSRLRQFLLESEKN